MTTKITAHLGEAFVLDAPFTKEAARTTSSLSSSVWTAETAGIITLSSGTVSSNVAKSTVTPVAVGCTPIKVLGTMADGQIFAAYAIVNVTDYPDC